MVFLKEKGDRGERIHSLSSSAAAVPDAEEMILTTAELAELRNENRGGGTVGAGDRRFLEISKGERRAPFAGICGQRRIWVWGCCSLALERAGLRGKRPGTWLRFG